MKKQYKILACAIALSGTLFACNAKKDAEDVKDNVEDKTNQAKNDVEDSIDNMMAYFKEKGVAYESDEKLDKMDFAAYEGRTFVVNGSKVYLYRVKSDDESMKKVLEEAKNKGSVKVNIDNKEQEYGAKVNGDFLMLYDRNADMKNVTDAFPLYAKTSEQTDPTLPQHPTEK